MAILFLLIYSFVTVAQTYKFPLTVSKDHDYLVDQNGKPFFYNGDTGWKIFLKLDKKSVIEYLVDRKKKKFNVIEFMLTGFKDEMNLAASSPSTIQMISRHLMNPTLIMPPGLFVLQIRWVC
ncbi:MAG: DUF4038 domain-containing protein [Chryseolinea sp.]